MVQLKKLEKWLIKLTKNRQKKIIKFQLEINELENQKITMKARDVSFEKYIRSTKPLARLSKT